VRFVRELKDAAGSKVAGMCCDIFCSNCPYTAGYAACWTKYGTLINITATFHITLIGVGTIYILRGRRHSPSPPLLLPPLPFSPFPPILPFPFPHAVQPFPPMSLFPLSSLIPSQHCGGDRSPRPRGSDTYEKRVVN